MSGYYEQFTRDAHQSVIGQRFTAGGREYELAGRVSDGAIGIVKKAKDIQSNEIVAVKFLAPEAKYIEMSGFADIAARFRREGIRGAGLRHENLVRIIAYEQNDGATSFQDRDYPCNPFFVMEYITGKTLESYILAQARRYGVCPHLSQPKLRIAFAITEALVYLHKQDLTHRDVKAANIFLAKDVHNDAEGMIKLGDFGIVKWNDFRAALNTGTLTVAGHSQLGTAKYMSPEQAMRPKDVTVASDIYALGATFYELFTNQMLPSRDHVLMITMTRTGRGSTASRAYDLGLGNLPRGMEDMFTLIFDMMSQGQTSRPSAKKISGILRYMLSQMQPDW